MKNTFNDFLMAYNMKHQTNIQVEFVHIPPYSPYLNAAEYLIHLIRQKLLKHLPPNKQIEEIVEELVNEVDKKYIVSSEQLQNIIRFIKRKPKKKILIL